MTTKTHTAETRPSTSTPRARDRMVDLLGLLAIVAVSAIVYVMVGPLALVAVDATAGTLYALWRRAH